MAEELDSAQKPKVELIKRQKNEQTLPEESVKNTPSEQGERKKVVVVKKKPFATKENQSSSNQEASTQDSPANPPVANSSPGSANQGAQKKNQPKIVVTPRSTPEGGSDPAAAKEDASTSGKPETRSDEGQVVSFPTTQRPAAAAGRVGGRYVGPRPARDAAEPKNNPPPRTGGAGNRAPRPANYRPQTTAPGEAPQQFNRPGGTNTQRPFTGNNNRPGGTRPSGNTQNRPGNFTGQRPAGGTPRPGGARPGGTEPAPGPSITDGKSSVKKSFKPRKAAYQRKEQELEEKLPQANKKKSSYTTNPVPRSIDIMEVISVSELARKMNLKVPQIISKLMSMGMMVTINEQIDADTASILASEYGTNVNIVSLYDETLIISEEDDEASKSPRPPVVTVMGHVDHGKTKLLDTIRSTNVIEGEFGGITQHIGAYMVTTASGDITFLDTPGHEAFTRMRARGAQVTDIVVLVVAADDGVMPQTVEAINHAKDANVPIIVAMNKMDKPEADPERVKRQLSDLGLMPEEWGGQTMFVELSALKNEGIDKLIDTILLEAEILDLKANYDCRAEGKVLEARIDHGRGIVATVMIERGTLKVGDSFVAGIWPGKVRALFNDTGARVSIATPSMPVEVIGFEGGRGPNAGEPFQVVDDEKFARSISSKRQELKRSEDAKNIKKVTLDNLYATIHEGEIQELKVIIKADVQGSAEALRTSLENLTTPEVRLNVIQALPGAINEGDVDLAIASNALIIGFNVRPVPKAKALADQEKVEINKYNVIYKAVEDIQSAMEGMLKPELKEEVLGSLEVRNIFKLPRDKVIAGCFVLSGIVRRTARVNVIRDGIVIYTGKISSLRRFKDDVREVATEYECGLGIEGFDAIHVGDTLEVFEIIEVAKKLSSNG